MNDNDTASLDALLSEIRALRVTPSEALQTRMMADAQAVADETLAWQADHRTAHVHIPDAAPRGVFGLVQDLFGGWRALGGLTACAAVGVGLGLAQPSGVFTARPDDTVSVSMGVDKNPLALLGG